MPATTGTLALAGMLALANRLHHELDQIRRSSRARGAVLLAPLPSRAGERAPFADLVARGVAIGLSLATTPPDLVRATCQCLAYAARHRFEPAGSRRE